MIESVAPVIEGIGKTVSYMVNINPTIKKIVLLFSIALTCFISLRAYIKSGKNAWHSMEKDKTVTIQSTQKD